MRQRPIKAILTTLLLLGLSLIGMSGAATAQDATDGTATTPDYLFAEAPMDRAVGSMDAPNTLIMYASNVCPHCGDWFNDEWPAVETGLVKAGQLRFVFRPLPSQPIQLSLTGFVLAECADDTKYFDVIEDQFARQRAILEAANAQDGAAIRAQYDAVALGAGLPDPEAVAACLADQSHIEPLQLSQGRAQAAGVQGTPAFIFNGQMMGGRHDAEAVAAWVEGRTLPPR